MNLSGRLAAIEAKAGDKEERPIVVVWETKGETVPDDVPENAIVVLVSYTNGTPEAR